MHEDAVDGRKTGTTKKAAVCEEARRLLDTFGEAVHHVVVLHDQQFLAIVDGETDANRFDILIHDAIECKQSTKYAYLHHLDQHGCDDLQHAEFDTSGTRTDYR